MSETSLQNGISVAVSRRPMHTREVNYRSFLRDDGLWDIEGHLTDIKPFDFSNESGVSRAAGEPIHHMVVRACIDSEYIVRSIEAGMLATPYPECPDALQFLDRVVGLKMSAGWRRGVSAAIGGICGCSHIRELLFNMATAAYQTIPAYLEQQRRQSGQPLKQDDPMPPHYGACFALALDGPVIKRSAERFYTGE
ncbi:DUF2889 domain-containing protein [Hoeflea alexandrii]|uniref:DUF2889 domain-containing protein n=1 Tax=Hoeflea alexandrii TaxID=288436 RepID=UPI0022AFE4CA|nr:DUF2889 domain-containing protein [Hoeflea alexandrii]MCZ4291574.1 DUF2889 domain-containing protein [Hoeflea alexandrii]